MARAGAACGMPSTREARAGAAIAAPYDSTARIERAEAGLRIGDDGPASATRPAHAGRLHARPRRRRAVSLCTIGRAP
ncbi:hypothetical protein [Burkholderia cenocepacia]|uniref:hypothetical protein n=1 Tax=Burkholderia cenocepacia TaxID=95486 RepID=UPI001F496246|nr:hypothetical protein [Burkholderia cenocepacia]